MSPTSGEDQTSAKKQRRGSGPGRAAAAPPEAVEDALPPHGGRDHGDIAVAAGLVFAAIRGESGGVPFAGDLRTGGPLDAGSLSQAIEHYLGVQA